MIIRIAVGIGCRLGCSASTIEALVRQALERTSTTRTPATKPLGLFTIHDKAAEIGLIEAASRLGLELMLLTREALREQACFVQTRSVAAESRFGVPSVAEAAALAGAGARARLIIPRMTSRGATCAVAESRKHTE